MVYNLPSYLFLNLLYADLGYLFFHLGVNENWPASYHKSPTSPLSGQMLTADQAVIPLSGNMDAPRETSLKDLPEEVKNYYSKHDSDGETNAGRQEEDGNVKQGEGSLLSPRRTSTQIRASYPNPNPKITVTPPRNSLSAPDGEGRSSQAGQGPSPHSSDSRTPGPNPAPAPNTTPAPAPGPKPRKSEPRNIPRHRFLSTKDWALVAHGLGGIADRESQDPIHPSNWWWPPQGMPPGLYKDVITQRVMFSFKYRAISWLRWILMFLQLLIGAVLTAIGSMSLKDNIPITVLGATNTTIAGLLAFLQNSGLPERYRFDKSEFETLEDHIKELLDSGIAPADKATDQIIAECFDLFQEAKETVNSNLPANYTSNKAGQPSASQKAADIILSAPSPPSTKTSSGDGSEKHV